MEDERGNGEINQGQTTKKNGNTRRADGNTGYAYAVGREVIRKNARESAGKETKTVSREDAQSTSVRHRPIHDSFRLAGRINASGTITSVLAICNPSTRTQTATIPRTPARLLLTNKAAKTCARARAAPQWDIGRPRLKTEHRVPHCATDGRCAQHSEPYFRRDTRRGLVLLLWIWV